MSYLAVLLAGILTLPIAALGASATPALYWQPILNDEIPFIYQSGASMVLAVGYQNILDSNTTGTVFASIRNSSDDVLIGNFSGGLTIGPGANATLKLPVTGVQIGYDYDLIYYATDLNGTVISPREVHVITPYVGSPLLGPEPISQIGFNLCNLGCQSAGPEIEVTYKNTSPNTIYSAVVHGVVRDANNMVVQSNMTTVATFGPGMSDTFSFYVGGLYAPGFDVSLHGLSTFVTTQNGSALSGGSEMSFEVLANGSLFIGQAGDWSEVGTPTMSDQYIKATFQNNLNLTAVGDVWLVVHNGMGQTVYLNVGGAPNIAPGMTGTAYVIIRPDLPSGTYYADIFATSVSGLAMSNATSFQFTV